MASSCDSMVRYYYVPTLVPVFIVIIDPITIILLTNIN